MSSARLSLPRLSAICIMLVLFALITSTVTNAQVDPDPTNNNQPDITLPSSVTTQPGVPVSFAPVVSDVDVAGGNMELEIDISDLDGVGGRSVPAGNYGTFTWGGGSSLTSDVAVTTLAAINTALTTFTYRPPAGFSGLARIVFEIDDQGNTGAGGVLSRTRFIDITIVASGDTNAAVNNQPDITLPGSLTTSINTPVTFSASVSDIDVGGGNMELEIDISDLDGLGPLSVPAGDYGTFTWGLGTGVTSDVAVTTLAAINTALTTFTYTPPTGYTGLARIVFEIDDQGNTGSEFPAVVLSRTRFIDITVTTATDTPTPTPTSTDAPTATPSLTPTLDPGGASYPTPPATPTCMDQNAIPNSVVRAGIRPELAQQIFCRILVQNEEFVYYLGYALTGGGNIGVDALLALGIQQAVDIYSPSGPNYYENGIVICLQGQGHLIWLAASGAPRVPQIVGSYEVDDFPGFTCITLFEPGMLLLVSNLPQ